MSELQPADIYTEPSPVDFDTLANLGPLRAMAGVWEGTRGLDVKPKAEGPKKQAYVERISLQPIDPVTNGPQLLYGLRYHTHITKPDQAKTYHEQVGYWLWEPATGAVVHTLTIPRGQTAMAAGTAASDATRFTLQSTQGHAYWGICSTPFLENNFRTVGFTITVQIEEDGSWGYEEDTVLMIRGQDQPFHHTDRNQLRRVAAPTPNPLAAAGAKP
ncbi:MAG: heme-binding beta-barrel domain-containing protein [Pseudorhodoferax sp.]